MSRPETWTLSTPRKSSISFGCSKTRVKPLLFQLTMRELSSSQTKRSAWKTENWRVKLYETFFPVNDLLRRKTQTSITIACLTLSVASTLFLLLFSSRIGVGITSASEGVLTVGLSNLLSQFIRFVGVLTFVVGAVLVSFTVFLMMTQRTKDFGLIKAAGCPNALVFGYYMTELIIVTTASCALGVVVGLGADFATSTLSSFEAYRHPANLWFVPLVFVAFFVLALVFGAKPLLNASRLSSVDALSPVQYYGLI